jgi:hypothetical protein
MYVSVMVAGVEAIRHEAESCTSFVGFRLLYLLYSLAGASTISRRILFHSQFSYIDNCYSINIAHPHAHDSIAISIAINNKERPRAIASVLKFEMRVACEKLGGM